MIDTKNCNLQNLTVNTYFEKFAFRPCNERLTVEQKVTVFAMTLFASIATGGLFAIAVFAYQVILCQIGITPTYLQFQNILIMKRDQCSAANDRESKIAQEKCQNAEAQYKKEIDREKERLFLACKEHIERGPGEGVWSADAIKNIRFRYNRTWSEVFGTYKARMEQAAKECEEARNRIIMQNGPGIGALDLYGPRLMIEFGPISPFAKYSYDQKEYSDLEQHFRKLGLLAPTALH
jgi:hypothetical protein